jgi:signal transduction histidine kinase/CheY-like chemotaxis protein
VNLSAPRKTPLRRGDGPSSEPGPSSASGSNQANSKRARTEACLVFLDDRESFLDAIRTSAERGEAFCVHGFHVGGQTGFARFLLDLLDRGDRPDALLIDLVLADSAEGMTGIDYLREVRQEPRLLGLPTIIVTGAAEAESAWDDAEPGHDKPALATVDGADDCLLGKEASVAFLQECRRRLPFWRVQARNRLWQTLLHDLPKHSVEGSWDAYCKAIVDHAFQFLHTHMDVDHAFLRLKNASDLMLFHSLNGPWAQDCETAKPTAVRILDAVLGENGRALNVAALSAEQAGVFGDRLTGKRMLGVALKPPEEAPFGVLTLVRDQQKKAFSRQDEFWIERLGESLAASLGERRHVQQLKNRQGRTLEFARTLDAARDEGTLCQHLAKFLQDEIHGSRHCASKVTVRLIVPGEPRLRRYGAAGVFTPSGDIPLDRDGQDNDKSTYAYVVNRCDWRLIGDVTLPEWKEHIENTNPGYEVHSELCVPISAGADGEVRALGAINMEHMDSDCYDEYDRTFVESIAAYASQALRELRHKHLARALLDWAVETHRLSSDKLWERVTGTLFAFCRYGVLLHLAPPEVWPEDGGETPWRVLKIHVPMLDSAATTALLEPWEQAVRDQWSNTLLRRKLDELRLDQKPIFESNPDNFVQIDLEGARQRSNALLPLVTLDGKLIGVLVLLWFHRPALDEEDRAMLATFGRYCAELVAHQADWNSRENQLRLAEQKTVLAGAAQQFEHVLANRLGPIGNALNEIKTALTSAVHDPIQRSALSKTILSAQEALEHLGERSRRAVLYMRVPHIQVLAVTEIWNRVVADMTGKANGKGAAIAQTAKHTPCRADPEILYNILLILMDNALDAVPESGGRVWLDVSQASESVELVIADNGPGVSTGVKKKLFVEEAISTKGGQGVALFLARQRARAMGGDLDECGSTEGARFVLRLPSAERAA